MILQVSVSICRGYPHNTSNHWSNVLSGGYHSDWSLVPGRHPSPRQGYPVPDGRGASVPGMGHTVVPGGVPNPGYPLGQDWDTPPPRTGYSWTGYAVDGMPLVVSCRRTVL